MSKYVSFEYDQLVKEYLDLFPLERPLFDKLSIWRGALTDMNYFIAGGFVMKLYNKMPLGDSDIDLWCTDRHGPELFQQALIHDGWKTKAVSEYAYTYDLEFGRVVQIIRKNFGKTIEKITNSFDFTNCKCYTDLVNVWVHEKAVVCLAKGTLKDGQPHNPYLHVARAKKYVQLGFKPAGVLKRKIHEARSMILIDSVVEAIEETKNEAVMAPQVLHMRHNQQLQPEAVPLDDGGAGQLYGGAALPAGGGIGDVMPPQVQAYAGVFDEPNVGQLMPAEIVPGAIHRINGNYEYRVRWSSVASPAPDPYSSFHNMGMYLPKYARWLEMEAHKKAQEQLNESAFQYNVNKDWFSSASSYKAVIASEQLDARINRRPNVRNYVEQNQAPRGPRQGR